MPRCRARQPPPRCSPTECVLPSLEGLAPTAATTPLLPADGASLTHFTVALASTLSLARTASPRSFALAPAGG
jgi:hypothetical protein